MFSLKELNYIDNLISKYSILEIKKQFLKENINQFMVDDEIKYLLDCAMLLVTSSKNNNINRVLKVATIIPQLTEQEKYILACRALLSKLKNYPTIEVIQNGATNYYGAKIPVMDRIREMYEREANSISVADKKYYVSDVQANLYNIYKENKNVSISAPTSIGKSFLFTRLMINELLTINKCLVYIVPTRALINQIINDVVEEMKNLNVINRFFVTSSSDTLKIDKEKKGIFVLTQERFYQLCNLGDVEIGTLIVDEAQNIMDASRGILLEYSIKYAKKIWDNLKIIFISPFVDNPELLLNKFSLEECSKGYCERKTTVRQNLIKLEREPRGFRVRFADSIVKERLQITRSIGVVDTIVNAYEKFNNGNNSIIYCNRPQTAIDVCTEILNREIFPVTKDEDLLNFAEFIEQFINKNYMLVDFVKHGIAFHYGALPAFIRLGIEELAEKGKFKILACTSTLLQGVNIPAQNIYIYNPKKNTDYLSNLEFWNLAGRAGRMSYDLDGNVILIDNENWENINQYDKKETRLKCATELSKEKSIVLKNIVEQGCYYENKVLDKETAIFLESGLIFDNISKSNNNVQLEGLRDDERKCVFEKINQVVENFEPPQELLIKLMGVQYQNIDNLWKYFREHDKCIEQYIIPHPLSKKDICIEKNVKEFDEQFKNMLEIVNEYIANDTLFHTEGMKKRLLAISKSWIRETPLRKIIFYNFERKVDKNAITKKVSKETRYINDNIRYHLVQSLYAYQEILKEYLKSTKREELIEKLVNLPMYLEIGACKDSTVELISLGLARELAIELVKYCKIDESNVIESLRYVQVENIPNRYAQKRIKEFIVNYC